MKLPFFPLLASLLFCLATQALAAPKAQLDKLYSRGGYTLFCQSRFFPGEERVGFIYSKRRLLLHYDCITAAMCQSNQGFVNAYNDLHNLYPVNLKFKSMLSRSVYGDMSFDVKTNPNDCGTKFSARFQKMEPPDRIKGNIARAMVYMSQHYHLPLYGSLLTYQKWNKLDPPDRIEKARNQAIQKQQGAGNPYITHPELIEKIKATNTQSASSQLNFSR